jgi:hypothetical protein
VDSDLSFFSFSLQLLGLFSLIEWQMGNKDEENNDNESLTVSFRKTALRAGGHAFFSKQYKACLLWSSFKGFDLRLQKWPIVTEYSHITAEDRILMNHWLSKGSE